MTTFCCLSILSKISWKFAWIFYDDIILMVVAQPCSKFSSLVTYVSKSSIEHSTEYTQIFEMNKEKSNFSFVDFIKTIKQYNMNYIFIIYALYLSSLV